RRNVVTTRFQTLRQLLGTAEHAHRLAADIHLEKKRFALTGLHAINLGDDRVNRTPFFGRCRARNHDSPFLDLLEKTHSERSPWRSTITLSQVVVFSSIPFRSPNHRT